MNDMVMNTDGMFPLDVDKSFYMTFDGKRCYCKVPVLRYSGNRMYMEVHYDDGDRENYFLVSDDGVNYNGMKRGSADDGRVRFLLLTHCEWVLLAGSWKCGGREGAWYINGKRA
jgi:hypothetical protein